MSPEVPVVYDITGVELVETKKNPSMLVTPESTAPFVAVTVASNRPAKWTDGFVNAHVPDGMTGAPNVSSKKIVTGPLTEIAAA
jgi:hypothetical protein